MSLRKMKKRSCIAYRCNFFSFRRPNGRVSGGFRPRARSDERPRGRNPRWRFRPPSRRHTPRKRTSSRSIAPPKALADFRESRKYFSRAQRPTDASIGVSAVWPFPGVLDCRLAPGTLPHRASICECVPPSNFRSVGGTGASERFRPRRPVSGKRVLRLPLLLICTNFSKAWSYLGPFTRLFRAALSG